MDKCAVHDDCFKRLYAKIESMDDKLDRLAGELRSRLHEGDVRFVQLEMRLARCEEQLKASASGRADTGSKITGMFVDLVKMAILAVAGAAAWAFAHGYGGG